MLKRDITYTNPFTDQEVTETHYFHISKADLITMEMEEHGSTYVKDGEELTGMLAKLQRIVDSEDGKAIMREFKDIISRAYGKKEGDRFLKSQEISDRFLASEAYSQLLWELCTQANASAEFVNGIIPKNLNEIAEDVRKQAELRAKGIEAQATAKAAAAPAQGDTPAESEAIAAVERVSDATGGDFPKEQTLAERIDVATAENPAVLTEADVSAIDSDTLKSGLATGRIKLS